MGVLRRGRWRKGRRICERRSGRSFQGRGRGLLHGFLLHILARLLLIRDHVKNHDPVLLLIQLLLSSQKEKEELNGRKINEV
jgi:hypothetical protein